MNLAAYPHSLRIYGIISSCNSARLRDATDPRKLVATAACTTSGGLNTATRTSSSLPTTYHPSNASGVSSRRCRVGAGSGTERHRRLTGFSRREGRTTTPTFGPTPTATAPRQREWSSTISPATTRSALTGTTFDQPRHARTTCGATRRPLSTGPRLTVRGATPTKARTSTSALRIGGSAAPADANGCGDTGRQSARRRKP